MEHPLTHKPAATGHTLCPTCNGAGCPTCGQDSKPTPDASMPDCAHDEAEGGRWKGLGEPMATDGGNALPVVGLK